MKWKGVLIEGLWAVAAVLLACGLAGCSDRIQLPSPERLAVFEQAGSGAPVLDLDQIIKARMFTGPYRAAYDDTVQLELPALLFSEVSEAGGRLIHNGRIARNGLLTLPDGRQIQAVGKTLGAIESAIVDTYYPTLVKTRPAVYAHVLEYATSQVRIVGAVTTPGIYHLRQDQMSLVALLMEAGGIVQEGAALIRVTRADVDRGESPKGPDPLPILNFRREPEYRQTRLATYAAFKAQDVVQKPSDEWCMRFQREGPLRTSGWVLLEEEQEVLIRKWLDIGSETQRRAFVGQAAKKQTHATTAELGRRLLRLADFLSSLPAGNGESLTGDTATLEWECVGRGCFATLSQCGPTGGTSVRELTDATGARTDIHLLSAVPQEKYPVAAANIILPIRGLNIPFADVPLRDGDSVVVEPVETLYVSVLGLVNTPGNIPYPRDAEYNLAEVLGFAGGMSMVAEPRYVSIYRLKADGTVASATFEVANPDNQEELTDQMTVILKPGDVVSVEHTPRTRKNVFLDRYFRLSMGMYVRPEQFWGGD